jgi:hypothetical protein
MARREWGRQAKPAYYVERDSEALRIVILTKALSAYSR